MATSLTKRQQQWLTDTVARIENWREKIKSLPEEERENELLEYNKFITDVNAEIQTIAEDFRSDWDNRSEKWQESERGQEVDEFIQEWENFELEEASLDEEGDLDEDHADALQGLTEGV